MEPRLYKYCCLESILYHGQRTDWKIHRFTWTIPGIKELPYLQRLCCLNLWTLEKDELRANLIEVYKMINGLTDVKLEGFLNSTLTPILEVITEKETL